MAGATRQLGKVRTARERHAVAEAKARQGFFVPLPATALASVLLVAILAGAAVFAWTAWPRSPADSSAEAGFLRDMSTHHGQAVEMSLLIRDRTSDQNLRYLATDIAMTQATQMGAMQGYLDLWDLSQTGQDQPMAWMDHPVDGLMPGMATSEQIAQLSSLPVDQAEVLFLQLMIRHHQGGVDMAEAVLDRSDQEQVVRLAARIVTSQKTEIDTMNDMLVARGQQPITDPLPDSHDDGASHEH